LGAGNLMRQIEYCIRVCVDHIDELDV